MGRIDMDILDIRRRRQNLVVKSFGEGLSEGEEKEIAALEQQIDDYEYKRDAEYNNAVDSLIDETKAKVKDILDLLPQNKD